MTVDERFKTFPTEARRRLKEVRQVILHVAKTHDVEVQETLKWGEPSYVAPKGSTIRVSWSERTPDVFGVYFNCNSSLVSTFRQQFGATFSYQENRGLIFGLQEDLPKLELEACVLAALRYHEVKRLPALGLS